MRVKVFTSFYSIITVVKKNIEFGMVRARRKILFF
nr:MAG TPA: hypothetical protein [Caudoviricetes sp.]